MGKLPSLTAPSATPTLVVPSFTLGDRAFPVAAARVWNSLPSSLWAVQSLTTLRRCLKAELFDFSFTWLSYCTINMHVFTVFSLILYSALAMAIAVSLTKSFSFSCSTTTTTTTTIGGGGGGGGGAGADDDDDDDNYDCMLYTCSSVLPVTRCQNSPSTTSDSTPLTDYWRWSMSWFLVAWTIATVSCMVSVKSTFVCFSRYKMQQCDSSLAQESLIISPAPYVTTFIGYQCDNISFINYVC